MPKFNLLKRKTFVEHGDRAKTWLPGWVRLTVIGGVNAPTRRVTMRPVKWSER